MSELTIEERLARLEAVVARLEGTPSNKPGWLERFNQPISDEVREGYALVAEYGRYFRKTGELPPNDWKPGDPIPETNEGAK